MKIKNRKRKFIEENYDEEKYFHCKQNSIIDAEFMQKKN